MFGRNLERLYANHRKNRKRKIKGMLEYRGKIYLATSVYVLKKDEFNPVKIKTAKKPEMQYN